ncbi:MULTISPECIES: pyridoxal 5'-phosphate synthase [unclassified Devosia]|uniref:pyridoxine/pyridoxamine 5'-phosphate oxidase n=1 Tax=unclassified Devosia TaxID=196773 RepID=UPI00086CAC96|nr:MULTISPECIES: pyridoxal 5'-phosphate synthase [unclassified Devosia]MBN9364888.1 pyridoxal 5'-phosphate synthase [Devosia sp.]ODS90244.1 MAG: pyridoxamine 5'-phosphate oxidase [Devosia sp. SCN 66-27]OJX25731.1 MAG: pyridoxamine 5'-phosphate oxidase [Devosia sp. 66-14]
MSGTTIETTRRRLARLPSLAGPLWPFDTEATPTEPHSLFLDWLGFAIDAGLREPHAMTLSSVDAEGQPDARILILKDVDAAGWCFASDAQSPKGRQLAANPRVALTFYWPRLGQQVRVRGTASPAPRQRSAADFLARSATARAIASLGRQSRPLEHIGALAAPYEVALRQQQHEPAPVSDSWTLYVVAASSVEFWQGRNDRRHVRLRYERSDGHWRKQLLWP